MEPVAPLLDDEVDEPLVVDTAVEAIVAVPAVEDTVGTETFVGLLCVRIAAFEVNGLLA